MFKKVNKNICTHSNYHAEAIREHIGVLLKAKGISHDLVTGTVKITGKIANVKEIAINSADAKQVFTLIANKLEASIPDTWFENALNKEDFKIKNSIFHCKIWQCNRFKWICNTFILKSNNKYATFDSNK